MISRERRQYAARSAATGAALRRRTCSAACIALAALTATWAGAETPNYPVETMPLERTDGLPIGFAIDPAHFTSFAATVLGADSTAADLRSDSPLMFKSTALLPQLILLEDWIENLKSPRWPEAYLGPVDADLAETGRTLFKQDCSGYHNMPPWRMTDAAENLFGKQFIRVERIPAAVVGTDPVYLHSFLGRTAATGALATLFGNKPVVPGAQFFTGAIGAVVERALAETPMTREKFFAANGFRFMATEPGAKLKSYNPATAPCETLNCLKAGLLLGIWATGPYLHNGSVPTIYELLSPPSERRAMFWTGGRKLDAERLGFVSDEAPGLFRLDTSLPNDGNGGHVFPPAGYSHEDRMAAIEYLKDPNVSRPSRTGRVRVCA